MKSYPNLEFVPRMQEGVKYKEGFYASCFFLSYISGTAELTASLSSFR